MNIAAVERVVRLRSRRHASRLRSVRQREEIIVVVVGPGANVVVVATGGPQGRVSQQLLVGVEQTLLIFSVQSAIVGVVAEEHDLVRPVPGVIRIIGVADSGDIPYLKIAGIAQDQHPCRLSTARCRRQIEIVIAIVAGQRVCQRFDRVIVACPRRQAGECNFVIVGVGGVKNLEIECVRSATVPQAAGHGVVSPPPNDDRRRRARLQVGTSDKGRRQSRADPWAGGTKDATNSGNQQYDKACHE